ncbi:MULTISPECIES: hypothetical protein [unclassified Imperialibacter]|uniref:hypothetical protein n=1 Tax=unclassified Imperialibacter TaxID=2629706 RepID=UPI00125A2686|nr:MULTISPECIES: hypothetical protein [unclassified Imperialibacter]CAD5266595.1 conserved exported hypothetical protein [Imperialibacter sp. 89]CAD5281689.1 conserved exported hypothetical protein [Imperialibacter sp. 75]VVT16869.1 conserved exported hypothetical protein [Imperialibacter sp. EC-SDR9]
MKKIYILALIVTVFGLTASAQNDFTASTATAMNEYKAGNLEEARFALQQSLAEVDKEIGKEILEILPKSIAGFSFVEANDNVSGNSSSFGGLFVHRDYGDTTKSVAIDLMDNSPMLAGINSLLAMPMIMNSSDGSQKVVKVSGYKALLQRKDATQAVGGYTLQIPFNQSLFTVDFDGAFTESEVTSAANAMPISEVAKLTY